jgi:hypothetical protein
MIEETVTAGSSSPTYDASSDQDIHVRALPLRHGFPLRVVAEDHYGSDWVKYVTRVSVERA